LLSLHLNKTGIEMQIYQFRTY